MRVNNKASDFLVIFSFYLILQFHSLKANTSTAAVLDYTSKANHIGLTLSPCNLRAHLCLYGESVIPLNQVPALQCV